MTIIFDLDYTLLDTKKLKDKLAEIFNQEGFARDYQELFKKRNINFNLKKYLAILRKSGKIDQRREKELKPAVNRLLKRLDEYLFPAAELILKNFKDRGHELVLLTFGDKEWHRAKINNLSIKKFFSKIIFEEKSKKQNQFLKSLARRQPDILIINDNVKETKEMLSQLGGKAKVFLVAGPYAKNIKHNWPMRQLNELI
jgi:FMN phosphatase YigB (HAD superfamily)